MSLPLVANIYINLLFDFTLDNYLETDCERYYDEEE